MANCTNHASAEGAVTCAACRLPFCPDCTIVFRGASHCGPCKNSVVRYSLVQAGFTRPRTALLFSLVGLVPCLTLFLQPFAIYHASQSLTQIGRDPALPGKGMAISAMIIGIADLTLVLLGGIMFIVLIFAVATAGNR